ncbi:MULTISPECIES: gluconokinase [unclassified Streptomyces]|uniref:gluconokinase n=1 Tax=unclassified Streptomyces TaxID=2593676 RepID=UPI00225AB70E|nr:MULTISPECIES: gluconokinase [unclassified Streptomyces]MCX5149273.1 gluconokinase [Streptomyces sp. NBC_00320]WSN52333.1 gluconokinase [Streptomyces sp. NBC_01296]
MIVVVLGVAGAGKSSVGRALAEGLGVPFLEGDGLHPAANIAKMAAGRSLDDADRAPWLRTLTDRMRQSSRSGGRLVVSCSALKRAYRDELRGAAPGVWCVYLAVDRDTARDRVSRRTGHFMPPRLVDSQFEILEPLEPDEPGATVDATGDPGATLARARRAVADFVGGPAR